MCQAAWLTPQWDWVWSQQASWVTLYFCLFWQAQFKKEEAVSPALSESIPKFYFPRGRPKANINIDNLISKIEKIFSQFPSERVTIEDMGKVAKVSVICNVQPPATLQIVCSGN